MVRNLVMCALLALARPVESNGCLPGAVPAHNRSNVEIEGVQMPIGLFVCDWQASYILNTLLQIVLEEKLGYNTARQVGQTSTSALFAVSGCTPPQLSGCGPSLSYNHIALEIYAQHALEEIQSSNPGQYPLQAGDAGYMSYEGLFIMKDIVKEAQKDGLHLKFYRSFQSLGGSGSKYFSTISDLVSATGDYTRVYGPGETVCDSKHEISVITGLSQSDCESRCSQESVCAYYSFYTASGTCRLSWACSETTQSGTAEVFRKSVTAPGFTSCNLPPNSFARTYLNSTDDAGGVKSSANGELSLVCLFDIFFVTPACRASPTACIPMVTYNMFLFPTFLQQAVANNLPFAIANLEGYYAWQQYVTNAKLVFYYWEPDPVFFGKVDRLVLPESNQKEFDAGILARAQPEKSLPHFVYNRLPQAAPGVVSVIKAFGLSKQALTDLMTRIGEQKNKVNLGLAPAGSESIYNISCQYLRESPRTWEKWLRSQTTCSIGAGLADSAGNMVTNRREAEQCVTCPVGTSSLELIDEDGLTYVCTACPPGMRQPQPGQAKCLDCAPGRFTSESFSQECTMCPRGKFQPESGMSRCIDCDKDLTTYEKGEVSDRCHCPADFFRPCKNPHAAGKLRAECPCFATIYSDVEVGSNVSGCLPCPEGAECRQGADELYLPCSLEEPGLSANGSYPVPKPGFYATLERPLFIYLCLHRDACPGGQLQHCSEGKQGIACGKCGSGEYMNKLECTPCSDEQKTIWVLPGIPVLLVPLLIVLSYSSFQTTVDKWDNLINGLANIAYVCLSGIQTVGTAMPVFPIIPRMIDDALGWTQGAWQMAELILVECSIPDSFYSGFLMKLLLPLAVVAVFVLTFVTLYPTKWRMESDILIGMYGSGYRFLFVAICAQNFNLFQTYLHPNGTSSMRSAPSITDRSQTWLSLFAVTAGFVMLNCLAVAACLMALLQAKSSFSSIGFRRRWKFILIQMRPSRYGWIIMLIIKGFYLACTSVLFDEPGTQVAWLQFGVIAYLSGVMAFMPWRSVIVCLLDIFIHIVLMLLFLTMPYYFDLGDDGARNILSTFLFTGLAAVAVGCIGLLVVISEMRDGYQKRQLANIQKHATIAVATLSEMTSRNVMAELLHEISTQEAQTLMNAKTVLQTEALAIKQPWFLQWRSEPFLKPSVADIRIRNAQWKLL